MTASAALEQVSVPEQRVGVEVGDDQVFVQGFGSGGHMIRRRVEDFVIAGFDDAGKHKPCNDDQDKQGEARATQEFHGGRVTSVEFLTGGEVALNRLPWAESWMSMYQFLIDDC